MDDLVADFVCEAAECLGGVQAGLARLAGERPDPGAAAEMLRRLHGLKGACGFVGFARAEALVHATESLLAALSDGPAPPSALAALGAALERLGAIVAEAAPLRMEPEGDDDALIAALESLALDRLARKAEPAAAPEPLEPIVLNLPPSSDRRARAPWGGLDALARGLGDRLGKRIELAVGGDDLRIASEAAASLRTALIALVRNACDHGVESPAERRAAAKPTRALLRLSVHRAGEGAAIELADDGRGVDPERIRACCIAAGRLDRAQAAELGETASQALIFEPGVTTAGSVTALSGRGLGLELVRRELESLGGSVAMTSTPGQGTRFLISLPASALASPAARSRAAA